MALPSDLCARMTSAGKTKQPEHRPKLSNATRTKMEAAETDPLLGQINRAINSAPSRSENEEMRNPAKWSEDSYDLFLHDNAFGLKQDENDELDQPCQRSNGFRRRIWAKLKFFLFDSSWLLSCFLLVAFLGFWLPKKRRSVWPLTFIPVFHLLFGLGAHFYFILCSSHRSVHIGSKMLLTALWISAFASYTLALYYFRYHSQEWMRDLKKNQYRAINVALITGLLLVSWVLFGDVYLSSHI